VTNKGDELRVLVLAPYRRDAQVICRVLADAECRAVVCQDVDELCEEIARGAGAGLLVEEVITEPARAKISAALAEQPSWSDFPLLIVASHRGLLHGSPVLRDIEGTSYLTRLERPLLRATLLSAVEAALQARARQYQVGTELAARREAEQALTRANALLEEKVRQRTAIAERRASDLRQLTLELSEAEHRERKRLAKLLHDELQQLLVGARLILTALPETPPEEWQDHLAKVEKLLRDCQDTSRDLTRELSPPVLQQGELADVITWLGDWFGETHGLDVSLELSDSIPHTPESLKVFLFHAVRELLFNVVKHSGTMEASVVLSFQRPRLRIEVTDEGEEFDPAAVQQRLEQPESFGLFNIKERIEALGGNLEMEKTSRGGACFRLVLPLCVEPEWFSQPVEEGPDDVRDDNGKSHGLRLLVVDDHKIVRDGFVSLLNRQSDMEVVAEAENGEQAIHRARALHPDVIVMDVNMPLIDGIEATRRIKSRQPKVVIVGLSLQEEESVARAMARAGANAYLSKNVPTEELLETIRSESRPDAKHG